MIEVGAGTGALMGKFSDYGIDDNFIKEVGSQIQPGNSAAFFLVASSTPDKLLEHLRGRQGATVLQTSLSEESEAKLREALASQPQPTTV